MNFVDYMKHKARMVKMDDRGECTITCESCPLSGLNNEKEMYCLNFEHLYPELAVEIVDKWAKENPVETYLSDFLKHYPDAKLNEDGSPRCCLCDLDRNLDEECASYTSCLECWSRPVEY